ncbi:MAG TPA: RNA polymerase sigma factor [Solirubrobacterales bacterium]|nr:RNA polymerase sigma factor [Solirubrobacterales bacterium]
MGSQAPDSELISASATSPGDFAAIFDRHFDAVYLYLQRRIGRDLAEELAAETFLVAFDLRDRYDGSRGEARPWLLGIATNLLRRHWRREVRELRAYARSAVDPVLDCFDGIEERLDAAGERRYLLEALAELSAPERDALLLAAWADLSYAEIAAALAVPVGTVRSRLSRARERIASALRETDAASAAANRSIGG